MEKIYVCKEIGATRNLLLNQAWYQSSKKWVKTEKEGRGHLNMATLGSKLPFAAVLLCGRICLLIGPRHGSLPALS